MAVPDLRWIGIFPSEISLLNIAKQPLNERETKMIGSLLQRPYIASQPKIKRELEVMLKKGYKAEIEGLLKNNTYISEVYLPNKLYANDFI